MDLDQVMRTTFAAREFTDEPVDDATIARLVERARFAPSGGNRQGWRVIVVRDPATRRSIRNLCEPVVQRYVAQRLAGENPWNPLHPPGPDQATIDATPAPDALVGPITDAPCLLVVVLDLAVTAAFDQDLDRVGVTSGASVYPFAWNLLLAARNEGLGGTLTTFLTARDAEARALLGVPDGHAIAAVLYLGRPAKQLTRLTRKPVRELAVLERFDGDPLPDP